MNFLHIYSSFRNKREIYIRESERRDIEEKERKIRKQEV